ncbi:MAG: cell surface receptor IPT/TIG domain-containing protein, partial [Bacteroidetes bacterium]|nr:cell surface receptor IPT/TIG domain-containing protein [Bacteroidota bacterium]
MEHKNTCRDVTMTLACPPPTIRPHLAPASGCGTSPVVITGTNFNVTAVTFGSVAAQSFVVNNATQITA